MTPFAIGGDIFDWSDVHEIQPSLSISAEVPTITLINVGARQEGYLPYNSARWFSEDIIYDDFVLSFGLKVFGGFEVRFNLSEFARDSARVQDSVSIDPRLLYAR